MNELKHLYFHVPFCDGKCVYCGFYSQLYEERLADAYIAAVGKEMDLRFRGESPSPETIYFGGGTPSILGAERLAWLCESVAGRISHGSLREWTVEANPGTLAPLELAVLKRAGVTRLSLGVQSFDDGVLRGLGRRHTAADVGATVRLVREAGIGNIGVDLIACLAGVDEAMWRDTLGKALALVPEHVSVYALSVEPGTRLERAVRAGHTGTCDDEYVLSMLDVAEELLAGGGYERYEVSNYARAGYRCLHNLSFWRGEDYLGFGPAAASRVGRRRWTNRPDLESYAGTLGSGCLPPGDEELLGADADIAERLAFTFRLGEGVDLADFARWHGAEPGDVEKWRKILAGLHSNGIAECIGDRWRLTKTGLAVADHVAGEFL